MPRNLSTTSSPSSPTALTALVCVIAKSRLLPLQILSSRPHPSCSPSLLPLFLLHSSLLVYFSGWFSPVAPARPTPSFGTIAIPSSSSTNRVLLHFPTLEFSSLLVHLFPNGTQHAPCTKEMGDEGTTITLAMRIMVDLSTAGRLPSAVVPPPPDSTGLLYTHLTKTSLECSCHPSIGNHCLPPGAFRLLHLQKEARPRLQSRRSYIHVDVATGKKLLAEASLLVASPSP